jgi:hypothetical protein
MKFYIDKLLLWLNDGSLRTLNFKNDKVNVVTGNSKTGKTAVLEIIDYCLCGSSETVVISYEHIGENVAWYGLRFIINDKVYTIARGKITEIGKFSEEYYFSQTGDIPEVPYVKMGESEIKTILEQEFSIDDDVTIAYGGRSVRKNTRLSYRYFLMLNTLSKDIIDNGKMFFDKMTIERYRDVWSQIFDLALGVIDFGSIAILKQIGDLQQGIASLEANKKKTNKKIEQRTEQVQLLVKRAKENGLIDEVLSVTDAFEQLESLIQDSASSFAANFSTEQEYERLQIEREKVTLQLAKLRRFKKSYSEYKNSLRNDADSLRPIMYIQKEFSKNIQGEYLHFLNNLSNELTKVKKAISEKRPFEYDIDRKMRELSKSLNELDKQLSRTAHVDYSLIPTAQKLISLGEIKAEYNRLDLSTENTTDIEKTLQEKLMELEKLEAQYSSTDERRMLITDTLNEYIQTYIKVSKEALDEYGEYCARFDYKKKILTLKKNKSASIANISSSSDHLYMHLCLFAGLHHMMLIENTPFVPSFLVIDQPSRPYFNTSEYDYKDSENAISNKGDWSKVKNIFKLWDSFFTHILKQEKHFQIIMLEHVAKSAWNNCEHVNLVEVFDGVENALIPIK